jgi:type IV pilus assembly protein PilV
METGMQTKNLSAQSGVMLIEALIGILIFSIGILALIGMQGTAIKNTTDARYRSEAAYLGTQIIGQMWVDIGNLPKYDKDYGAAYSPRDDWVTSVAAALPGIDIATNSRSPTIEIGPDAGLGLDANEVRVLIQWLQPGESDVRRVQLLNRINGAT